MRFLVLQHAPHEGLARYENHCRRLGIRMQKAELWKDYKLPSPSEYKDYDAAIIMGGPQGVNDDDDKYPSKKDEIHFIQNFPNPILGHCLGSQLIASACGGRVYPGEKKECGFYRVRLTPNGKSSRIFRGFESEFPVFQWHGDVYDLPQGAVLLAEPEYCNQAFIYENKIGILWHWEMNADAIGRLLVVNKEWFEHGNHGNTAEQIRSDTQRFNKITNRYCRTLFDNFVAMV